MREFGKVIADPGFLVAAIEGGTRPWAEPTEIVPVPTPEEMQNWYPDEAPEKCRFRWEINVQTGERKAIELTLDEYRARHVAKAVSRNEYIQRKRADDKAAARKALMESLVDKLEADPTLLDKLAKVK
jgi:hypothetical protein